MLYFFQYICLIGKKLQFHEQQFAADAFCGVLYLCEVILPVYQLLNDVEVVCVGYILHGHIQA